MSETTLTLPGPTPTIPIDLGDGKKRFLRYSIGTIMKLKRTMGRAMFGRGGALTQVDEEILPQLILAGLLDEDLKPATDVTIDHIEALPAARFAYLMTTVSEAFKESLPPTPANPPQPAPTVQ